MDIVQGRIIKTYLECKRISFLVIPGLLAKELETKWKFSDKKSCFVLAFTKKKLFRFSHNSKNCNMPCLVIIPGATLAVSESFIEYHQHNFYNLLLDDLIFPEVLLKAVKLITITTIEIIEINKQHLTQRISEEETTVQPNEDGTQKESDIDHPSPSYNADLYYKGFHTFDAFAAIKIPPVMIESSVPLKQIDSRGPVDEEFEHRWCTKDL